jgi:hypothetical protein
LILLHPKKKKFFEENIYKKSSTFLKIILISGEEAAKLAPILYAALTFSSFCQNS